MKKVFISYAIERDIAKIIDIQIENHFSSLIEEEKNAGFVSLLTPSWYLKDLIDNQRVLVVNLPGEDINFLVGYLILVDRKEANGNRFLRNLAEFFDEKIKNKPFFIVAQIAISKRIDHLKRVGIGTQLYQYVFDYTLNKSGIKTLATEVAVGNIPSVNFHKKIGFKELGRGMDKFGNEMIFIEKSINEAK